MFNSKKIISFIKITRPINVIITFLVVVVAIIISEKEKTELSTILLTSLSASLIAASGNIINDIYDIEADRISHPKRVLVLGNLQKKEAWFEYLFFNFTSVFLVAYLSPVLLFIVIIAVGLLFIYSSYLKRLPLIGNIFIAFITALAFIYGGVAANNFEAAIIPAVIAFLINLMREIVKDMQDISGDSKLNLKTFPIKYGFDKSKNLILIIAIILMASTFYPFFIKYYKIEYFILVMIFVNPIIVYSLKLLYKKSDNSISAVSGLLKFNMIIGLLAIYLGK